MARYFKNEINILGYRKVFFTISLCLVIISVLAICINGFNMSAEFEGGTSITINDTGDITTEEMRAACEEVGIDASTVQTSTSGDTNGFIIRSSETDPNVATAAALDLAENLGLSEDSYTVDTIGPDWGATVLQKSIMAFVIAMLILIVYISIRFEWKMSITAVLSVVHVLVIIMGVYALFQIEITPNVIAAVLTITGYSLYDTVVAFHRINENASPNMHHSYITIANHSVNQVLPRSINTTLTALIPVLCMLIFGGETLKDFALAMALGLALGAYSTIGIAVPIFALWKSQELVYAKLAVKYGEGKGDFSHETLPELADVSEDIEDLPDAATRKAEKQAAEAAAAASEEDSKE